MWETDSGGNSTHLLDLAHVCSCKLALGLGLILNVCLPVQTGDHKSNRKMTRLLEFVVCLYLLVDLSVFHQVLYGLDNDRSVWQ